MKFRGGEFSIGTTGNFQLKLTENRGIFWRSLSLTGMTAQAARPVLCSLHAWKLLLAAKVPLSFVS